MLVEDAPPGATLADRLGLTGDAVAAACAELVCIGLARPSWEKPDGLRPVPAEAGLAVLLARKHAELLRHQHELEQGRAAIEVLAAESAARRGGTDIEEVHGADAVRETFERLAYATRRQLLTLSPVRHWTPESAALSRPLHRRLLASGVELRFVHLASVRNDPTATDHLRWLVDAGAHVRTAPVLPMPLVIADRERAVVPLDPDDAARGACVLRGPGTVAAVSALFAHEWRAASPLGERSGRTGVALTADERALLRLLLDGHTDDQVARRMGVSVRTVGRMCSALMARLGARSRFQAGALALAEGWLDDGSAVTSATAA
jgi:DNA-binding CsgD family transcriptional regulator